MQKVICNHTNVVTLAAYGQGNTLDDLGIEVIELKECPECGKTFRVSHRGKYVQVTASKKIS